MAIQIASLFASIGADTSGLNKGLGSAKQSLQGFGGEMAKQVIGTVSLTAAIYKAGQTVAQSVSDWADYADSMRLSAQMAGVTTEEMSRLAQAADDFRVPIETMQRSMEMALKNGFTPTIENIAQLSDELIGITDPAARAAAASKIFGKSYADMMPFLLAGGDAIRGATAGIDENLIVTAQAAAEAKRYKDELDNLEDTWTGLKNTLGKFLVPVMTNVFTTLTEDLKEFVIHMQYLGTVMDYWGTKPFNTDNLGGFLYDLNAFFTSDMSSEGFMEGLQARIAEMNAELALTPEYTAPAATAIESVGLSAANAHAIMNAVSLSAARDEYLATASVLREDLAGAYDAVKTAEDNWKSGVAGQIKVELDEKKNAGQLDTQGYISALETLDNYAGTQYAYEFKISESIPDLVKSLLEDPEGFLGKMSGFEDAMMPLDTSVSASMQLVQDLQAELQKLERVYNGYVNIWIRKSEGVGPAATPGAGYNPVHGVPQASGGNVFGGSPYIVGERGPELFVPNANGQIIPNNELGGGNSDMLGDILMELQNQPSRIKVAIREAMALVGG